MTNENRTDFKENPHVPQNDDFETRSSHSFDHGRRVQVASSLQNAAVHLKTEKNVTKECKELYWKEIGSKKIFLFCQNYAHSNLHSSSVLAFERCVTEIKVI